MDLEFAPLHPAFGAEVVNVSASDGLGDETLFVLKNALLQYHMLLFRGRCLTATEQVKFTRRFGDPEVYPAHRTNATSHPEIIRISNSSTEGYTNIGAYWHHDGSFQEKVTELSFFHLLKVPGEGGDTMFADMHVAYEALSLEIKAMIDDLKTVHNNGTVHALVRRHPVTGRKALYLSVHLVGAIDNMDKDESRGLLDYLARSIASPENTHRQKWIQGDLMIVDNASVVHRSTPVSPEVLRLLQRTTTKCAQTF